MQADQLKQRINRIEECADEAKRAVQQASGAPQELQQCVDSLHNQARQAQQSASSGQQMGEDSQRQAVMQLEQTADRAVQVCRKSGGNIDPQAQQAVQRAHDEISSLKKQIQMG